MTAPRKNLRAVFESVLLPGDAPMPSGALLNRLERLGYLRETCYAMVSRAFGDGLLVRTGTVNRYAYRLPRDGQEARDQSAGSAPSAQPPTPARLAPEGYAGPAFAHGHPPIHTGTPCGGDDELPPALGAWYRDTVGRIFDREVGYLAHVE